MTIGIVSPLDLRLRGPGSLAEAVIVDARRRRDFVAGHLPGAVWIGWEQWCARPPADAASFLSQEGYWGVLAPVDEVAWDSRLGTLGLGDNRPIVVYADGPASRGREGRIAWMLSYLGAVEIALLDGGWSGWIAAGGDVQSGEVTPLASRFSVRLRPDRRYTLEKLLRDAVGGTVPTLIDTRSAPEYAGEAERCLSRRGHLPGARLLPFTALFESDGRYVSREEYLATSPMTGDERAPVVAYCEVGVRASLFAMVHEAYTGHVVAVYDGSLSEWALYPELPIEQASAHA